MCVFFIESIFVCFVAIIVGIVIFLLILAWLIGGGRKKTEVKIIQQAPAQQPVQQPVQQEPIEQKPNEQDDKENRKINFCYSCGVELKGSPPYCYNCGVKLR